MPGMLPHLPWLTPEVVIDGRLDAVAADPVPHQGARRGSGIPGRRTVTAWLLAGLMLGLALGLTGCGAGGGSDSATRPLAGGYAALVGGRHGPCRNQQQEKHQHVTFQRIWGLRWG